MRFCPLLGLPPSDVRFLGRDCIRPYCSVEGINLGRGANSSEGIVTIVAHELAHLAQFKIGEARVRYSSTAACEDEAERAVGHLLAGRPFACIEAADPAGRLYWNRFGHFYSVYFMGVVTGLSSPTALKIAINTQLPDLVDEYDAPHQTVISLALERYRNESPNQKRAKIINYVLQFPVMDFKSVGDIAPTPEDSLDINAGLHCLTGTATASQRRGRFNNASLLSRTPLNFEFGFALHALGDSYAHTPDEKTMYTPVIGHGLSGWWQGLNTLSNYGHGADNTSCRWNTRFRHYIENLYTIFTGIPGRVGEPMPFSSARAPINEDVLSSLGRIGQINDDDDENKQISELMNVLRAYCDKQNRGLVEIIVDNDSFPAVALPARFGTPPAMSRVRDLAKSWSSGHTNYYSELDSVLTKMKVTRMGPDPGPLW